MLLEIKEFKCDGFPTDDDIRKICFMILSHGCIVRLEYRVDDVSYRTDIQPGTNFKDCKELLERRKL